MISSRLVRSRQFRHNARVMLLASRRMRVLLVYTNRTRIMEPAPPIGLSYVATATRDAGHDVKFLDLMLSGAPLADLKKALQDFQPEVVGFSIRNIDNIIAQRCAKQFDKVRDFVTTVRDNSKAQIVIGGSAVSILGAASLEQLPADFAIVGEGEISFPQLLAALRDGKDYTAIAGVTARTGRSVLLRRSGWKHSALLGWRIG